MGSNAGQIYETSAGIGLKRIGSPLRNPLRHAEIRDAT